MDYMVNKLCEWGAHLLSGYISRLAMVFCFCFFFLNWLYIAQVFLFERPSVPVCTKSEETTD